MRRLRYTMLAGLSTSTRGAPPVPTVIFMSAEWGVRSSGRRARSDAPYHAGAFAIFHLPSSILAFPVAAGVRKRCRVTARFDQAHRGLQDAGALADADHATVKEKRGLAAPAVQVRLLVKPIASRRCLSILYMKPASLGPAL